MNAAKPPKTILICDDEKFLREILVAEFQSLGWTVFEAPNGVEGTKSFELHHPTAIVTDVRMPHGNGVDMLRRIPEATRVKLLIYIVSGFTDHSEEELKALGGRSLIQKPFKLDAVVDQVERDYAAL